MIMPPQSATHEDAFFVRLGRDSRNSWSRGDRLSQIGLL